MTNELLYKILYFWLLNDYEWNRKWFGILKFKYFFAKIKSFRKSVLKITMAVLAI